jgi:DNA-binding transcriptional MerR regulator
MNIKSKAKSHKLSHYDNLTRYVKNPETYYSTKKDINTLREPKFLLKKSKQFIENLTYKKINDWEEKGLISGSRNNKEAGWRKFSINDITKLYVITDLRRLGVSLDKIKNIIEHMSKEVFDSYDVHNGKGNKLIVMPVKKEFLCLEYFVFVCLEGSKMLLLVDENQNVFFLDEADTIDFHFRHDAASSPLIILPFFSYIEKISTILKTDIKVNPDTTIASLLGSNLNEQEKKILKIISNKRYREITILKSNNEEVTIKAKSRKSGNYSDDDIIDSINGGDYQSVTIITEKGKRVALIQEERIRG